MLFATQIHPIQVAGLSLQVSMVNDIDEILDHYVTTSPTNTDMIPYFTRLWESGMALAEFLATRPQLFLGFDVLELGCGLGLPSLVTAKLGAKTVLATDYHPDNEAYLKQNTAQNQIDNIIYQQLDWRQPELPGKYQLVYGSDLIYDREMVPALVDCIDRFCAPKATFILADPGRAALQQTANLLQQKQFHLEIEATESIFLLVFTR